MGWPLIGVSNLCSVKKSWFSTNISLYLGNNTSPIIEDKQELAWIVPFFKYLKTGMMPWFINRLRSYINLLFTYLVNKHLPDFSGTPAFDAESLRNGTSAVSYARRRHSYNEILIGTTQVTHALLNHGCQFEWPWMILSDLTKYSVTRSIARPLCVSWASCLVGVTVMWNICG